MSHNYSVRCICGEWSESYNHAEDQLIKLIKESHVLYLLSLTDWRENISAITYYHGLAEFVIEHFPHGGFSVKGEYESDVAIEVIPDKLDNNRYYEAVVCEYLKVRLNEIRETIDRLENRLSVDQSK